MDLRQLLFLKAASGAMDSQLFELIAIGNQAVFNTNVQKPLNELYVPIKCRQIGSGDPSPSNIRSIIGYTGLSAFCLIKNDIVFTATEASANGLSWEATGGGSVVYEGTPTAYSGINVGIYNVKGGEIIHSYLVGDIDNVKFDDAWIYDESWNHIGTVSIGWTGQRTPQDQGTIDLSEYPDAAYVSITLSEYSDNVTMNGTCYPVVGEDLSIPDSYNIEFGSAIGNCIDDSIKYQYSSAAVSVGNYYDFTIPLKAGSYTLSTEFFNGAHYGAFIRERNDPSQTEIWYSGSGLTTKTFIIPKDGMYRFWFYRSGGVLPENIGHVTLIWNAVLYGGGFNVTTGILSLTHAYRKYIGASGEQWYDNSSHPGCFVTQWAEVKNKGVTMCNMSPANNNAGDFPTYGYVYNQNSSYNIRTHIVDDALSVDQFKSWLAEHPLELVCPLVTPITIQMVPTQINTLIGSNTIWTNTIEDNGIKYLIKGKESTYSYIINAYISQYGSDPYMRIACSSYDTPGKYAAGYEVNKDYYKIQNNLSDEIDKYPILTNRANKIIIIVPDDVRASAFFVSSVEKVAGYAKFIGGDLNPYDSSIPLGTRIIDVPEGADSFGFSIYYPNGLITDDIMSSVKVIRIY